MKRITFLAASILFLMACNNEIETGLNFPEIPDNPDTRITLKLSDAQIFTYSTATASECYIDSLWVLRFQGNTLMESVLIPGDRIARNGQATQMLPQLPFELKNGDKIILLANTGVKTLPTGLTATNINEKFPMRMAQLDNISYYSEGE
ncbi:MAG: hypothetical protein LBE56_13395, partial [Tannerella sp.]|nr:hypothetical protein [Tannerella sp.]